MEEEVIREKKVERKENNPKKKEKVKKFNINISSQNIADQILELYKTKLKKIHLITFAIIAVIYIIAFVVTFNAGSEDTVSTGISTMQEQLQNTFFFTIVIMLTGLVPYFYLSFTGAIQIMSLMSEFWSRYVLGRSYIVSLVLGGLVNCFGVSLLMAIGFYLCYLTTKRRKYYNASQFGIDDIKLQFYEIRKQNEKVEKINNKKMEKAKKVEACNVKIPYIKLCVIGAIGYLVQIIGLLIARI